MTEHNLPYLQTVRELSDRLVEAQRPIRILDAIKWNGATRSAFFASGCRVPPAIDETYYANNNPLDFDPAEKRAELHSIGFCQVNFLRLE